MISLQLRWTTSRRNRRAQISLTMTTLAIMVQHFASGGKTLVGMIYPDYGTYALFIRNRLIDIGMISVPWLFYFSHPMFHDRSGRVSSNT
uniref:Serpentine receptor class gamma n=2 Tax=Caenorhabditis tropicalis TaxID=1561998 RepID=A0A1I7T3F0_9PELO